jgi:GTPase SAR1 family protein
MHKIPEFKIIVIGDSNVGKTSIIVRATQDVFGDNIPNTVGFSFQKMNKNVKDT